MKYRYLVLTIYILLHFSVVSGQYYDTGQDPASVKWMQIKTDRFTVIYPESYGAGGKAFAQSLDDAYSKLLSLFPEKKFRIPVIIHSLSTESNGYVAWAPKRMEIYPTPEQNTIPMDMNKQLAIHELAHVFQMESLNQGFSKAFSILLGEQTIGLVAAVLPMWFLEGDAVFAETYLSESGRGRTPSFQKQVKALTVEKSRYYNYDKSIHGSYKDYVPDYYEYGYQTVTWALAKNDKQIWNKVLKYSAGHPYFFNPMNISLTKNAGLTKEKLFNETFDSLKTIWTKESKGDNATAYETVNPDKNGKFFNYYSPLYAGKDSVIAIKTSLSAPPVFMLINTASKEEERLHTPGQMSPWLISFARGKLVWVENEVDIRWENRGFSVIKLFDVKTRKTRKISFKSRYLSASISPDGKTICAVENTTKNINNLVFIDAESGKLKLSVPAPGNSYLQRPQWEEKGEKVTVILLTDRGEGIMSFSLAENNWQMLIEAGTDDLQSSFLRNDSLFYSSSKSGTDNIYLRTPDKVTRSITRSRYGASDLILEGNNLIFSDYSISGNNIAITKLNKTDTQEANILSPLSYTINRFEVKKETPEVHDSNTYTPEPYRKWQHPFRFHSWMPFYADLEQIKTDPASIRPGLTFLTQNNLSSLISTIGYEYSKEKNHIFHTKVTWQGQVPVFETRLDYGDNPQIYKLGTSVGDPTEIQPGLKFSNSVSVPLQFSSGRFSEFLQPSFNWDYSNKYIYLREQGTYDYGQSILSGRLYFSNYHRAALRDIYPRWAQVIDINYSFAPFDKAIYGTATSVKTAFYIPGILANNGIKLRFEKEKQNPSKYLYGSGISFPRGYRDIISEKLSFLSADYVMPLIYPDLSIISLMYIKRIRGGIFFDYASGTDNYYFNRLVNGISTNYTHNYNETFASYGFDLLADFHVLRIPYMISAGIQTVWTKEDSKPAFSLLFNIDLFGWNLGKRSQ